MSNVQRPSAGAPDLELVNKIDTIEFDVTGDPPVHILIKVKGSVLRNGYTNPVLVLKSETPDDQGNLTYYFAAEPPMGGTPGRPIPIEGRRFLFELQHVKQITVVSATNEIYKRLP